MAAATKQAAIKAGSAHRKPLVAGKGRRRSGHQAQALCQGHFRSGPGRKLQLRRAMRLEGRGGGGQCRRWWTTHGSRMRDADRAAAGLFLTALEHAFNAPSKAGLPSCLWPTACARPDVAHLKFSWQGLELQHLHPPVHPPALYCLLVCTVRPCGQKACCGFKNRPPVAGAPVPHGNVLSGGFCAIGPGQPAAEAKARPRREPASKPPKPQPKCACHPPTALRCRCGRCCRRTRRRPRRRSPPPPPPHQAAPRLLLPLSKQAQGRMAGME